MQKCLRGNSFAFLQLVFANDLKNDKVAKKKDRKEYGKLHCALQIDGDFKLFENTPNMTYFSVSYFITSCNLVCTVDLILLSHNNLIRLQVEI